MYARFFDSVFKPFNELRDVDGLRSFHREFLPPVLGVTDHETLCCICIQMEDWKGAREQLCALAKACRAASEHHRQAEAEQQRIDVNSVQRAGTRNFYAGMQQRISREWKRLREDIARIDRGDFAPLLERTAENIAVSEAAARGFFGKNILLQPK